MSKIYLVFGDKCFMFISARPLEHNGYYFHDAQSEHMD